jgi:hypothetical protein
MLQSLQQLASTQLAQQKIIRQVRQASQPAGPAPSASTIEGLLKDFQLDLEASGNAEERTTAQGLSTDRLRTEMAEDLRDLLWLDQQLQTATVTEQEARQWFKDHQAELTQPERWQVAHLFLSGHQKPPEKLSADMQQLWQRLQQGEPWENLCILSEDERSKHHAGHLGWLTAARCPSDFIAHLRRLRIGQISSTVQTKLGWHIIKLLDYQPAKAAEWQSHRSEIIQRLNLEKRSAALLALIDQWATSS